MEFIANDFKEWENILFSDLEYLTGNKLAKELPINKIEDLRNGFRLCPKYPFILGGEFSLSNLYLKYFTKNISINAHIALQVYSLEDGQKVILK